MIGDGHDQDDGVWTGATDLFFSLAAVLIILLSVSSQSLRSLVGDQAAGDMAGLADMVQEKAVWLVLARADGLVLHSPAQEPLAVGLDDILTGTVDAWARQAQGPIWVVIEEGAADSAFLLETGLAQAEVRNLWRVRLTGSCARPQLTPTGMTCDG